MRRFKGKRSFPALLLLLFVLCGLTSGADPLEGADEEAAVYTVEETVEESTEQPTEDAERADAEDWDRRLRVGLFWGEDALEGANLLNETGRGYDFGYYDEELSFVPLYGTEERGISMLKDWSLYYAGGQYTSEPPASGGFRVGCYHIRLGTFETAEEAAALASEYDDGFAALLDSRWTACCGSYVSQAAAESAMSEREISGSAATASSRCITVVATETGRVLFQFDGGEDLRLGVLPRPEQEGERAVTWCRGYKYYGGFEFFRRDGGDLTVVNVLELDDYICGVVPYEMSPSWPMEALKAQAVSARTYAASQRGKHRSIGFDLCNTTCCQAYLGLNGSSEDCEEAVRSTGGVFVTYEGELCSTYYHSCDGGATEDSENVFYEEVPYLRGVADPYEALVTTGYESWSYDYTADEITRILQQKGYGCAQIIGIAVSYTGMGNVRSLKFTDRNGVNWSFTRSRAQSILSSQSLDRYIKSMRFTVTDANADRSRIFLNEEPEPIPENSVLWAVDGSGQVQSVGEGGTLTVLTAEGSRTLSVPSDGKTIYSNRFRISGSGWGHNVGMSQHGARAMALEGFTYDEILKFYYSGVDVQ